MRMMLKVIVPVEQGNLTLKEGIIQKTINNFVEAAKPESTYFTTMHGQRTGIFYFDLKDVTLMPALCEPFFQNLNAEVYTSPVMNLEELRVGIEKIPKSF